MKQRKVISPVTRLSGLMSIQLHYQGNTVSDAKAITTLFRGFETMLKGRKPTDAPYFTQRICGICSIAHGVVSSYMLDKAYGLNPPSNLTLLRNFLFGSEFLQNHIRHFYLLGIPDFIVGPNRPPFKSNNIKDTRLTFYQNETLFQHYLQATEVSALCHELSAIFGGKAPHQHGFLPGGITVHPTADKITKAKALLENISKFIKNAMLPDTQLLAAVYSDYFEIGKGYGNFMSFGLFPSPEKKYSYCPGVIIKGKRFTLNPQLITENEKYTYDFEQDGPPKDIDYLDSGKYSWTKAPRYAGHPMEVGPLARKAICGKYAGPGSTMDRIMARTEETMEICNLMAIWLDLIKPQQVVLPVPKTLVTQSAIGLTDAPRGTLLHQADFENDVIANYDVITPSAWNFSPKGNNNLRGPVEQSLVDTFINDMENPIEAGRIIRAFDPCVSCSTH